MSAEIGAGAFRATTVQDRHNEVVAKIDQVVELLTRIADRLTVRVEQPVTLQHIDAVVDGEVDDKAIGVLIKDQLGLGRSVDQQHRLPVSAGEGELSDVTSVLDRGDGLEQVHVRGGVAADGLAVDDEHAHDGSPSVGAVDVLPSPVFDPIVGEVPGSPVASPSDDGPGTTSGGA